MNLVPQSADENITQIGKTIFNFFTTTIANPYIFLFFPFYINRSILESYMR
jgi:hypothetical protein